MRIAGAFFIVAYGVFSIAAQTLLFREFVTTFEGNDISVGVFFGSWFLWVGLGALLIGRSERLAGILAERIEWLMLLYLPAFALELLLIVHVRELAGIQSYALLSVQAVLLWSMVVTAPVSLVTGVFFPTACRWASRFGGMPVSRVYMLEAAGSFAGGLAVTVLLGVGVSTTRVALGLAGVLPAAVLVLQFGRYDKSFGRFAVRSVGVLLIVLVGVGLAGGYDRQWNERMNALKWRRLLPAETLEGSFRTAHAEYLYGTYRGQWIVLCQNRVVEALDDPESTGRIGALVLCQNPGARRVLVVGEGLALCRHLLQIESIDAVHWAYPDREYAERLKEVVPAGLWIEDDRFEPVPDESRAWLSRWGASYDLVIVNLPGASSCVLNRYYTEEFFRQVRGSLREGAVVAVCVPGGENVIGAELAGLGASTKATLEQVFSRLVLVPGEQTWFLASDSDQLTGEPAALRDRFAAIAGAERLLRPEALMSVYLPDRAERALQVYSDVDTPKSLLVNRDRRPLAYLYNLLLVARKSGAHLTRIVELLAAAGLGVFLIPVAVYVVVRTFWVTRGESGGRGSSFDSLFLVFSAGWVGIGAAIILMYLYQTRFGTLYLYVGVISSLFMFGLTGGAFLMRRCLAGGRSPVRAVLFGVIVAHVLVLASASTGSVGQWGHVLFALAFAACGLCTGCYVPIAAHRLAELGVESGPAGSRVEAADHLGAMVGGFVTSLLLAPALGPGAATAVLVALLLANVLLGVPAISRPVAVGGGVLRAVGYWLFGTVASLVLCSNLLAAADSRMRPMLSGAVAQSLAGTHEIEQAHARLSDGRTVPYFGVLDEQGNLNGYVFSTEALAPHVRGFGGKLNIVVRIGTSGELLGLQVVRSNETPSYLKMLDGWLDSLGGTVMFEDRPFDGVAGVSGATVSSKAILDALGQSGARFARDVLGFSDAGRAGNVATANHPWIPDAGGAYLIVACAAAIAVTMTGGFRSRLLVLTGSAVLGGLVVNAQYSIEQVATLLSFDSPTPGLNGAMLLVIGVPLVVGLFGNVYCGYVCPFGALQELAGYLIGRRFKPAVPLATMRPARFVKYVLLAVIVSAFFLSRDRTTLRGDVLVSVFAVHAWAGALPVGVAVAAVIGSLLFSRFWCRYLCPAGAFLSLFNHIRLLKRLVPVKRFARCEYGLTAGDHLDCIYCDRCRYPAPGVRQGRPVPEAVARPQWYFIAAVLALGVALSAGPARRFVQVAGRAGETLATSPTAGEPRDVDAERIKTLIDQNRLSNEEARFYKKAGE